MRVRVLSLMASLLLLFSAQPAQAATHAAVRELPVLQRIDDIGKTVVVVRGRLTNRRAKQMVALARGVYQDVNRRFLLGDRDIAKPVQLCLFDSSEEYNAFVTRVFGAGDHSPLGFYQPGPRIVVANLARSIGNLRHELVHPLLGDDFPKIPAWLNEGMGSLYGTAKQRRRGFTFLVNYRLRAVREAIKSDTLPSLADIANSGRRELYGPHAWTYYGTSRYLLLYLDRKGKLDAFFRAMRRARRPADQLRVLGRHIDYDEFVAWAKKQRIARRSR